MSFLAGILNLTQLCVVVLRVLVSSRGCVLRRSKFYYYQHGRLQAQYQLLQQRFLTEPAAAVAAIAAATAAVDDDNYTAKTTKAVDQY